MTEPALTTTEAEAKIETKTAPRVKKSDIEAGIADVSYLYKDTLTIAVIKMKNGFQVVGTSACVDATNYDKDIGDRLAYDRAFAQLWALAGFVLATRQHDIATLERAVANG